MNSLSLKQRVLILTLLVGGNSLRSTARIADVSRNTVDKLLQDVGSACLDYQDKYLRNLPCKRVQCDEIWSFVRAKEKNAPEEIQEQFWVGDVWTWIAVCADTKIVPCWHVDDHTTEAAERFIRSLAGRLSSHVQLTTDTHKPYLEAVESAFSANIDCAMLIKIYGRPAEPENRYSPAECERIEKGISTSDIERQNLTMRMSMRCFTRLTNAFSKKLENHMHAISLHYMYYNFGRVHKTLKVTPAMEAGVTDHIWNLEEIANLVSEQVANKRHAHKKKNSK